MDLFRPERTIHTSPRVKPRGRNVRASCVLNWTLHAFEGSDSKGGRLRRMSRHFQDGRIPRNETGVSPLADMKRPVGTPIPTSHRAECAMACGISAHASEGTSSGALAALALTRMSEAAKSPVTPQSAQRSSGLFPKIHRPTMGPTPTAVFQLKPSTPM